MVIEVASSCVASVIRQCDVLAYSVSHLRV